MSWNSYGWQPYVPVAQRRAKAARELAKQSKKGGCFATPVILAGRTIAKTFWGKAWCDNLEAYSDYANRLPRGRTYVRNGSVVDLKIAAGKISAQVAGSSLYRITVNIKPLAPAAWRAICQACAGQIDTLIELLQGKISAGTMQVVTRPGQGLFPSPKEISLDCSCPDGAYLCKHLAATLYGVGARLDTEPELLFLLRGADPAELISQASAAEAVRQTGPATPGMSDAEMADVFGIELTSAAAPSAPSQSKAKTGKTKAATPASAPAFPKPTGKAAKPKPALAKQAGPVAAKPKARAKSKSPGRKAPAKRPATNPF